MPLPEATHQRPARRTPEQKQQERAAGKKRRHPVWNDPEQERPLVSAKDGTTRRFGRDAFRGSIYEAARLCKCELRVGNSVTLIYHNAKGEPVEVDFPTARFIERNYPAWVRSIGEEPDTDEVIAYLRQCAEKHEQRAGQRS